MVPQQSVQRHNVGVAYEGEVVRCCLVYAFAVWGDLDEESRKHTNTLQNRHLHLLGCKRRKIWTIWKSDKDKNFKQPHSDAAPFVVSFLFVVCCCSFLLYLMRQSERTILTIIRVKETATPSSHEVLSQKVVEWHHVVLLRTPRGLRCFVVFVTLAWERDRTVPTVIRLKETVLHTCVRPRSVALKSGWTAACVVLLRTPHGLRCFVESLTLAWGRVWLEAALCGLLCPFLEEILWKKTGLDRTAMLNLKGCHYSRATFFILDKVVYKNYLVLRDI